MNVTKVLVTGAYGLLGKTLCRILQEKKFIVIKQGRDPNSEISMDLTDLKILKSTLHNLKPNIIINLASLTNVDECEKSADKAYSANVQIVKNLSKYIAKTLNKCHLIQISTDQVYRGTGPHKENEARPINRYAQTKFSGEIVAKGVGATVLRTNFVGKSECPNRDTLSDWFVKSIKSKKKINLFNDVFFSPLEIINLSKIISKIIKFKIPGIFNLGSKDGMSKANFCKKIAKKLNLSLSFCTIKSVKDSSLKAPRPKDMRLNNDLFEKTFKIKLPTLKKEIDKICGTYLNEI